MDVSTCHYDVSSEGHRQWLINDEIIADLGTGIQAKIKNVLILLPSKDTL